jgi:NitT/TauT family transport system substrate-binding protein
MEINKMTEKMRKYGVIQKIQKLSILIIAVVLLIGAASCNFGGKTSERRKVTIGMVTFPGYAPLYLAKEKNLYPDVDVTLVRIESIGDLRAAMNAGRIDMYAATYDIFQNMQGSAPPGIAFIAIDESHGADGVVVKEGINSMADLKGKIVGAEPGFPPYFILQYLLNKENMTLKDVNFKDLPSQDAGNAFAAGKLDAAGTYEPYLTKSAEIRKGAKILISSVDTEYLIVDFLFASDQLGKEHPEALRNVAKGWFAALDYYKQHEEESIGIMANAFGVSHNEMKDFKTGVSWLNLDDNKKLFDKSQPNNAFETFSLVGDILAKNQGGVFRVKAEDKLTDKIVNEIANEKSAK